MCFCLLLLFNLKLYDLFKTFLFQVEGIQEMMFTVWLSNILYPLYCQFNMKASICTRFCLMVPPSQLVAPGVYSGKQMYLHIC